MTKCKTKTFEQVCRGANREEMESGPSKTVAQTRFCWVRPDCLHWERKKREILGIERRQLGGTGAGEGALSESAPNWRGTALQYPHNAKKLKPKKNKHSDKGTKKCCGEGLVGEIRFFSKKNSRLVAD